MAEDKKSFVAYADWKTQFDLLSDEEAGKLIKHIFSYVNDENPIFVKEDRLIEISFQPIKNQLKRDLRKYEAIKAKRSEAGKRSAEIRSKQNNQNPTKSTSVESVEQTLTNSTVTVNENDTVNDNVDVTVNGKESIKLDSAENKFSSTQTKKNIEDRLEEFRLQIEPFKEKYSSETLNDFWRYWTEKNSNGKKMRFEMQKVFDVGRRLITWSKNEKNNFNGKTSRTTSASSWQQRVDEVAEFRRANQQSIIERLQKHITGNSE